MFANFHNEDNISRGHYRPFTHPHGVLLDSLQGTKHANLGESYLHAPNIADAIINSGPPEAGAHTIQISDGGGRTLQP